MLMLLLSCELPPGVPGKTMRALRRSLAWTVGETFSSRTHDQPCSAYRAPQKCLDSSGTVQQGQVLVGRRVVWSVRQEGNTRGGSQ